MNSLLPEMVHFLFCLFLSPGIVLFVVVLLLSSGDFINWLACKVGAGAARFSDPKTQPMYHASKLKQTSNEMHMQQNKRKKSLLLCECSVIYVTNV